MKMTKLTVEINEADLETAIITLGMLAEQLSQNAFYHGFGEHSTGDYELHVSEFESDNYSLEEDEE
jgi:two-component sensor histidine kinase